MNSSPKKQFLTPADMDNLWKIMSASYGKKWTSQFGFSDETGIWLNLLAGITKEQFTKAITTALDTLEDWPPDLPEFKKLCLNIDMSGLQDFTHKYAMKMHGFDSFYQNQMTYSQISRAISPYKEEAKEAYIAEKTKEIELGNPKLEAPKKKTDDSFVDDIPYPAEK
jgi:hypothetical protein